ncbi:MAG: glycosyltransferase family 2 protein [Bacteroidales bacterium]|nr:glycosyltransferase family 2 protein [Bacteroidales bacterium]
MMKLSIIIPCYNEELVVNESYKQLAAVAQQTAMDYELIFINDGSKDNTYSLLKQLSDEDKHVKIINFARNFGHQCAVTAGINNCTGDLAVIIDADLQDPPEVILQMLEIQQRENANVVYGVRKSREGESRFKLITAKYFYRILNKMSDVKFPVDTGDFRLIDRKIIDQFNQLKEKNKYIRGLISWMGYKQVPCYYERKERFAGETKYPLKKMIKFATTGLLSFSKKPLKLAIWLGTIAVVCALIYALIILILKLVNPASFVVGWTSIILITIFFGGVQLLSVGILGEYIGNLFDEAKDRPEYIIDNKVNF